MRMLIAAVVALSLSPFTGPGIVPVFAEGRALRSYDRPPAEGGEEVIAGWVALWDAVDRVAERRNKEVRQYWVRNGVVLIEFTDGAVGVLQTALPPEVRVEGPLPPAMEQMAGQTWRALDGELQRAGSPALGLNNSQEFAVNHDSYVDARSPLSNYGGIFSAQAGRAGGQAQTAFFRASAVSVYGTLTFAEFAVWQQTCHGYAGEAGQFDLRPVSAWWSEGMITYENQPASHATPPSSIPFELCNDHSTTEGSLWRYFDVTSWAQNWSSGAWSHYGVRLDLGDSAAADAGAWFVFSTIEELVVERPKFYTEFVPPCYTLSLSSNSPAGGSTSIFTPQDCPGGYTIARLVHISASPNSGYVFVNWTASNNCRLGNAESPQTFCIMDGGDATVTANFVSCKPLAAGASPSDMGSASVVTTENCSGGFTPGTPVSISASPKSGHQFTAWSASGCTLANPDAPSTTCTMGDVSATVTAHFEYTGCHALTAAGSPAPLGTAQVLTAQNCSEGFMVGTAVSISAVPNGRYEFDRWTASGCTLADANATATTCTIDGTGAAAVTAHFQACSSRKRADFNASGASDLWWRNLTTGANYIWYVSASGLTGGTVPPPVPNTVVFSGVGDFNDDGSADVLWRNGETGQVSVWFMVNGALTGGLTLPAIMAADVRISAVGDFNGDGYADILWRNVTTGANSIWYITASGFTGGASVPTVADANLTVVAAGDFNADGRADILWRNEATGAHYIWLMNGGTLIGGSQLPAISNAGITLAGTGDFNGDCTLDLLWRDRYNSFNYIWFISDGALAGGIDLSWVPGAVVAGVGDFNGDGFDDVLWRRTFVLDVTTSIWFVNFAGYLGDARLPPIPQTLDVVAPK